MEPNPEPQIVTFEAKFEIAPPGTPATPRPPHRPRGLLTGVTDEAGFTTFTPTDSDSGFARELADRVLEYVRSHPAGGSAEQLAALVQQLLSRRPA